MRINNNLMAMNTHRMLGINNNKTSKSVEKLSSGYRINRAGDDAAGLAISEKMRGQIRGLDQASRNSQDGISMIQTAEGALNETQAILQRMRELSVQSANDTNVNADRTSIQDEINQLSKEITRISSTTEFNTQKLLNGGLSDVSFQIGANQSQELDLSIDDMRAEALGVVSDTIEIGSKGSAITGVDADLDFEVSGIALQATQGGAVAAEVNFSGVDDTQYIETFENAYSEGFSGDLTLANNELSISGTTEFDWNTAIASGSSITITKASGGSTTLSVDILAVGSSGAIAFSGADNFATYNSGTGSYEYSAHGVEFSVTKADFDAAASGDSIQFDFANAGVASGGAVFAASGTHSSLSTYSVNGGSGAVTLSDITFTSGYPEGVKSIKISGAGLDVAGGSIKVTMYDSGGTALSTDNFVFSGADMNGLDSFEYNSNGVNFTLSGVSGAMANGVSGFTLDSTGGAGSGAVLSVVDNSIDVTTSGDVTFTVTDAAGTDTDFTVSLSGKKYDITDLADKINTAAQIAGFSGDIATASGGDLTLTAQTTGGDSVVSASGGFAASLFTDAEGADSSVDLTLVNSSGTTIDSDSIASTESSVVFEDSDGNKATFSLNTFDTLSGVAVSTAYGASDISRETAGIDVSTQSAASSAITTINSAIEAVSTERSKLGAVQNRLEHTIKNLDTSAENLQASESRIRDVDMAAEMMKFTKNNILQQAAQSMLAQANQQPQGVLQLLR